MLDRSGAETRWLTDQRLDAGLADCTKDVLQLFSILLVRSDRAGFLFEFYLRFCLFRPLQ